MLHRSAAVAALLMISSPLPGAVMLVDGFSASDFLRSYAGFTKQDLARVAAGTAVVRALHAESDEVAVAGGVFMAISRDKYIERFRNIAAFKRNPAVLAIGRFGAVPATDDMRQLSLDDDDLSALRRCKPSDCGMRMDAGGMKQIAAAGLEGAGAEERGSAAIREYLAKYAANYIKHGDAAMMKYEDRSRPRSIADDLRTIVQRSPYFSHELAAMQSDVSAFAGTDKSVHEHFLYWSVEKIAGTPVISLTHAIIGKPASTLTAIATRQIYGSHFFYASLGLTLVADTPGPNGPGVTVIYINRSRVDAFGGLLGPVKRTTVRSRARSNAERLLSGLKTRLEKS
jgi:hypothetical protein